MLSSIDAETHAEMPPVIYYIPYYGMQETWTPAAPLLINAIVCNTASLAIISYYGQACISP